MPPRIAVRAALETAPLALLLLAAAFLERGKGGVELHLFAVALVLGGSTARRGLAALGRGSVPPLLALALEVTGLLVGLGSYPFAGLGVALVGLAALGLALPPLVAPPPVQAPSSELAARLERALVPGLALAALAASLRLLGASGLGAAPWPQTLALLALETWGPRAPRSPSDAARRASGFALVLGGALLDRHDRRSGTLESLLDLREGAVPLAAQDALALAAIGLALALSVELLLRLGRDRAPEELARGRRRLLARVLALLVPLGLVWALGELAFGIVPNRWRELTVGTATPGRWHVPGARFVYLGPVLGPREVEGVTGNELVWNREGMHDVEHERARPGDRVRVAVLGDSYVEGTQVATDALYHRVLERELAPRTQAPASPEALAFAASGWGQVQELEALRTRASAYVPDLVLAEFLPGNDVRNDHPVLEALETVELSSDRLEAWAIGHRLWFTAFLGEKLRPLERRRLGLPPSIDPEVFQASPPPARARLWEQAWSRADSLVGGLATECASQGALLAVVVFTTDRHLQTAGRPLPPELAGYDLELPARRMSEICARRGVPCLDLAARFLARNDPRVRELHLARDHHWNALGHRWAAEETARFLEETGLWGRAARRARER